MKNSIIALIFASLLGLATTSTTAFAWHHNGDYTHHNGSNHHGNGQHGNHTYDSAEYQAFLKDTQQIRTDIMTDRLELENIMVASSPDMNRFRTLSEEINKKETQLAEVARKNNIQGGSYNYGHNWNCGISGHNHGFGNCW